MRGPVLYSDTITKFSTQRSKRIFVDTCIQLTKYTIEITEGEIQNLKENKATTERKQVK